MAPKRRRISRSTCRSGNRSSHRSIEDPPSSYITAARNLIETRELAYKSGVRLEKSGDALDVARDIVSLFQTRCTHSRRASNRSFNLRGIENTLKVGYAEETDFNIALFLALRSFLELHGLVVACKIVADREIQPIVFKSPQENGYAIGIAREVNWEQEGDGDVPFSRSQILSGTSGVAVAQARLDHCCCLLKQSEDGTSWKVVECLAVVELKMSSTNECESFAANEAATIGEDSIHLRNGHGALSQVMFYTMGWVLPSLAKMDQLGNDIPWAVLVGKKVGTDKSDAAQRRKPGEVNVNRWVSGNIYVPETCGDEFQYAVTGYGKWEESEDSIRDTIAVYLETILFGLVVGKEWMESTTTVIPRATSGKNLCIGQKELQFKLRGNATIANFPYSSRKERRRWDLAQGEIFTGKLNLAVIFNRLSTEDKTYYIAFNETNQRVCVVVKVSSRAVHQYLNHSDKAWAALNVIYANRRKTSLDLSNVLYAVYQVARGLITVTANLSPSYDVLRPKWIRLHQARLTVLWKAFRKLVMKVLFPMACLDCIHPDLRPGYDVTSNILCEVTNDGGRATMQIIDYESIVLHRAWIPPKLSDRRYIRKKANARVFLWWQCLSIFFSWKERKYQQAMKDICLETLLMDDARDESNSDRSTSGDEGTAGESSSDSTDEDDGTGNRSGYEDKKALSGADDGDGNERAHGRADAEEQAKESHPNVYNDDSDDEDDEESDDDGDEESDNESDGESNEETDDESDEESDNGTTERPDWFGKSLQKFSKEVDMTDETFKRALKKLGLILAYSVIED